MGRYGRAVVAVLVVALGGTALSACGDGGGSSESGGRAGRVVYDEVGPAPSAHDAEQAAAIMQHRLRDLGVGDASVKVVGHTLVATGTGLARPAAAATKPGLLEFRPVDALLPPSDPTRPDDDVILPGTELLPTTPGGVRYSVGPTVLDGSAVSAAKAEFIPGAGWVVITSLTQDGARKFNDLAHVLHPRPPPRNSVAIVLDGVVRSAPAFQEDSFTGDIQISGSFTRKQAEQLAVALNTGALPVHLQVEPAGSGRAA